MAGFKVAGLGRRIGVGGEFLAQKSGLTTTGGLAQCLFTCPAGKRYIVTRVYGRWSTATSVSGGTVSIERVPTGTAAGSGTNILSTELAADGTANTVNYGVINDTEGSSGKNIVEPGESLYVLMTGNSGTLTALAGLTISVNLREIPPLAGA